MYSVGVSDHVLVAHSLRGAVFGPAQRLHGATYEVRVEVSAPALDEHGIVIDIGRLRALLSEVLAPLAYRNLDELPEFAGRNTTTEVLCQYVHAQLRARLGPWPGAELAVTLIESPVAWARYRAPLA
ncbi:MAG TPA: 6-carboxytetrahydropterin synthase [Chloroflexota bacterium]|nr:6-carboxytetrahydropterin synthase [Chloroflexota bacterium]HZU07138.1 6-carboxytetrahydropterin synthase [Chloroflexota bacterium]